MGGRSLRGATAIVGVADAASPTGELPSRGRALEAAMVSEALDDAGLSYVRIVASGGLDEYELERLIQGGAPIDMFGVGTRVGVSADAPYCDMVYKMVCYDGRPVMKLSVGKASLPGGKQIFRRYDADGKMAGDVIALEDERHNSGEPLLTLAMADGRRILPSSPLDTARQRVANSLAKLPDQYRKLRTPERYPVFVSDGVQRSEAQIRGDVEKASFLRKQESR